ncbi:hypothetical protein CFN16_12175 [Pseudomonas fluorescens]|uniref:Uncharacterized protein n=1 Tax=Pseudomonas fluorescens TaxID=294 RepID=A0A345UWJ4_PSEFL|nr:hypothetical protein [Pseudomonas fluorescens]AXJ04846.1 hypothetical protein CFN16_12175 [Pseudomonas fluorescens]
MPSENKPAEALPILATGKEPKPYPDRLCHIDYTVHPHRCGCLSGDEEAQRRFDEYQRDIRLATAEREVARLTAERDALQQRLNAADQRIDELTQERESLIAYGRSLGLDEASTLCSRMAYDEYYPAASRFRFFVPKAQEKLGNVLIKAANAIANLPAGPHERFRARLQKKANGSANMIDHDHVVDATEKVAQPFTEQFIEDHLGKMPT